MLLPSEYSRPIPLLAFLLPLFTLIALILVDTSFIDFPIAHLFYHPPRGFFGQDGWLLETLMHDRIKQGVIVFGVIGTICWVISLFRDSWKHWQRPLAYFVLAGIMTASIVPPVKRMTNMHCPWDLKEFGGPYTFVTLLEKHPEGEREGKCWPAGHAGTGFALFSVFFMLRDRRPKLAKRVLWGVIFLGSALSLGRMMQGAHFLTHGIATGVIDWLLCLGVYRFMLYRKPPADDPAVTAAEPTQ